MAAPTSGSTRLRLEADARREQIVASARRLFAERPFEAVSINDIAVASGTTRTNVYHHFSTKRDLFLEVIQQFSHLPDDHLAPSDVATVMGSGIAEGDVLPPGSVADHVTLVLGRWLDLIDRNRSMFVTMLNASSSADPQVSGVLAESMRAWESRLSRIIGLDPADPAHHAMVKAYQASVSAATAAWLEDGALDKEQVHRLLSEGLLAVGRAARPVD